MNEEVELWRARAKAAETDANRVLSELGYASARVVFLDDVAKKLSGAPVDVREYFDEAILCLRHGLTRSAVVVAWSGFFSVFCEAFYYEKEAELKSQYSSWDLGSSTDFRENNRDAQIISAAKKLGFIKAPMARILDGKLSERNQCAHPTVYKPSANPAIGYVDFMIEHAMSILASQGGQARPKRA